MEAESEPFEISSLKVDPEDSEISAPVKISLGFTPASEISDFRWRVSYMIDTVMKRQILQLLETDPQDFPAGTEQQLDLQLPEIDVTGIKRKHLLNVGLLMLEGGHRDGDEFKGQISVNMVVNVRADKESGGLRKLVLNPLAED